MTKKRMGLFDPVKRMKKPKNSIKTGESKHLIFYALGNRNYYVLKILGKKYPIYSKKRKK